MWKHFFAGILVSTIITRFFVLFIFIFLILFGAADFPASRMDDEINSSFLPRILISLPGSLLAGYIVFRLEKKYAATLLHKFFLFTLTIFLSSVCSIFVSGAWWLL